MDDQEFLSYCAAHSETNIALFSGEQIARALRLAGKEELAVKWDAHPSMWRSCDLSGLVKEAWRLREVKKKQDSPAVVTHTKQASLKALGWKAIFSAPMDGTPIRLLYGEDVFVGFSSRVTGFAWQFLDRDGERTFINTFSAGHEPTHWKSLED